MRGEKEKKIKEVAPEILNASLVHTHTVCARLGTQPLPFFVPLSHTYTQMHLFSLTCLNPVAGMSLMAVTHLKLKQGLLQVPLWDTGSKIQPEKRKLSLEGCV